MNIGTAAQRSGLTTKTVRYYADIGLVSPDGRSGAGYRVYGDQEVSKLVFVRRARDFGFSIDECRELLALYEDRGRSSRDVKNIALAKIEDIKHKMSELQSLHNELSHLAENCNGDDRPDCPILTNFAQS